MIGLTFNLARHRFRATVTDIDSRILRWAQGILLCFFIALSLSHTSIQKFLHDNLQQMLGADITVTQFTPLAPKDLTELQRFTGKLAYVRQQQITLTQGQHWQQAQLKAVGAGYPLQGTLSVSETLTTPAAAISHGPARGEIWVDPRLFSSLQLTMDQQLRLGRTDLRVTGIIHHEPDRLLEGHSVAMRAMIHGEDFDRARLLTDKTRHRYLMAVDSTQHKHLQAWIKQRLPGAAVNAKKGGRHPLSSFWQRVENFFGLSSLTLMLLAAIACLFAGRRQLVSQKRFTAIAVCMGMRPGAAVFISFLQWLFNFCLALVPALAVGQVFHLLLIDMFAQRFAAIAPTFDILTIGKTCGFLMLLFALFQVPFYWQLLKVSPGQLIKDIPPPKHNVMPAIFVCLSFACLVFYYSDNWRLSAMILVSVGSASALLVGFTLLVLMAGEKLTQRIAGHLPYVFFIMRHRLLSKTVQILGLGLSASLLLSSVMLSADIAEVLTQYSRQHFGNLLITQATGEEIESIQHWSHNQGVAIRELKHFKLAQLIEVNHQPLEEFSAQPSEALSTLQHPIRLSWSRELPANNRIIDGTWRSPEQPHNAQISVELEVAQDLGLALNDRLTFMISGSEYQFTISSVHVPIPGKSPITFWFQIPSELTGGIAAQTLFIGSAEVPDQAWEKISVLWNAHPTLKMLSVDELTSGYDRLLGVFGKLLLAFSGAIMTLALIVITASIKGYENEDRKRTGLLLCLGQKQGECARIALYEWIITASIASLGAVAGTWITGVLIYREQFSLEYRPDPAWLLTISAGVLIATCIIGMRASHRIFSASARELITA